MNMPIYISAPIYLPKECLNHLMKQKIYEIDYLAYNIFYFIQNLLNISKLCATNKTFLDVGCNIGTWSFLFQRMGAKHIHAIDIDICYLYYCIMTQLSLQKNEYIFSM